MPAHPIKPTSAVIKRYYKALEEYAAQGVEHELAVRSAFQALLEATKPARWLLVPEETVRVNGRHVRPDATLRDDFGHRRGYWEAKDTGDDLDAAIAKKRQAGYPLTNTIFENGHRAVLYQNGGVAMDVPITEASRLADLLNRFYEFTEPPIGEFYQAVEEFKERVPELAKRLVEILQQAHADNKAFQTAFDGFFKLCQRSLNPNISLAAVDEMLVQHLLTERLMRTVFGNPDFIRKNVIAAEVENVIAALVSHSFSRDDFLKSLDRFYLAIEDAARTKDFSEKQHFLNTVYERFFQGYSVRVADTHGIVYTPQPIVDFMCGSVVELLKSEFNADLGDPDVFVLDPCVGTGNFIVNLLGRVPREHLETAYESRFFANEVMLLPYYIASLNIEHAYYKLTGQYEPFEGMCFVDTLDLGRQLALVITERNTERVERQKKAPITVIIGNPPYNMGQVNENDNNKNREYKEIDRGIRDTYARDSKATLKNKLYDPYVRFFHWATTRLKDRDGIVCFVSNNSFVDQIAFDGMRKHLRQFFATMYHVDLHGNVRKNPKLSGTTHNVFGIQVGVGITVGVRKIAAEAHRLLYHRVPEIWRKEEKLRWLSASQHIGGVEWRTLLPDKEESWLPSSDLGDFSSFMPIVPKAEEDDDLTDSKAPRGLFAIHSLGVSTNRDIVVYGFDTRQLSQRITEFAEAYNAEVDRYARKGKDAESIDAFVDYGAIKWSSTLKRHLLSGAYASYDDGRVRKSLYRPFTKMLLHYDNILIDRPAHFRRFFPTPETEEENRVICVSAVANVKDFQCLVSNVIPDLHLTGDSQCFPFYVYDKDGSNRRENITDWAANAFRVRYGDAGISKWDIFWYVYAVLHHPGYREKFRDNLKRELPRIPLAGVCPLPPLGEGPGMRGTKLPLPPAFLAAARDLRKRATDAESLLWELLRIRQLGGLKFRRQHPIGTFILDFYCDEAKLAVEIDGGVHEEINQARRDAERTTLLETEGIHVIRFWNDEVLKDTERVMREISEAASSLIPPVGTLPPMGEGSGMRAIDLFRAYAAYGKHLGDLHLNYEAVERWPLEYVWDRDVPVSWRVEKMRLSKDRTELRVNEALTLRGIPPVVFDYRLGNRSALEWVVDQYQVKTDKRSGITSDPNTYSDDERYIVNLVRRVVRVSIETVGIVNEIAKLPFEQGGT